MERLTRRARGFSLIELVVAVGVIATLLALASPALLGARAQARLALCQANLSELVRANGYYAGEHGDRYCPGAADFLRNLHRWHGTRSKSNLPFDPTTGPLASYLSPASLIRQCPSFDTVEAAASGGGFERNAGGYGYNGVYLGAATLPLPDGAVRIVDDRTGAMQRLVHRPAATVMFADTALAAGGLIEYSFVEPRFQPTAITQRQDPSIHFRHAGCASVGWADGHVDARVRTFTWKSGLYRANPAKLDLGWFGEADDNGFFDLR